MDSTQPCDVDRLASGSYSPGTSFACIVEQQGKGLPLHFQAESGGGYHLSKPAGVASAKTNWLSTALLQHAENKRVIVVGDKIARFVDATMSADASAMRANYDFSPTHCPPTVDLSGGNQVLCAASIEGQAVPYYVSIKPKSGLVATRQVAIIDNSLAAENARASVNARLLQAALPAGALVDCGSGLRVVAPGSNFECTVRYGAKSAVIIFEVIDVGGTLRFTVGKLA